MIVPLKVTSLKSTSDHVSKINGWFGSFKIGSPCIGLGAFSPTGCSGVRSKTTLPSDTLAHLLRYSSNFEWRLNGVLFVTTALYSFNWRLILRKVNFEKKTGLFSISWSRNCCSAVGLC
mmetsp:Transcript_15920/g.21576  ORF Transcript_15920/g.21576 Transcript_15920/m.21576 type:complete len:119 (-) Transcript_15920:343-699(-)